MAGTNDDAHAQTVLSTVERRLARLRFDLHDGPLQDVHLLAIDLALLREGLLESAPVGEDRDRLLGMLDDTTAQLVTLERDLRRLITAVQSPFLPPASLTDTLREITSAFAARTGVEPQIRLAGDFSALTDSQQITLLALMREALSNIRKHGDANSVSITISAHERGVDAEVIDDGRGFDPSSAIAAATEGGHLGLVGMRERVRMLGGETDIESRPGGPTRISVTLPPWPRT
jgi:signal transduction histidine kinase